MNDQAELHLAARFRLLADASPGLLSRVLEAFAKRDLIPDTVRAQRLGALLRVEVACTDMPAAAVPRCAGTLRQIVGLRLLEVEEGAHRRAA
jgi:hypothetical protein